MEPPPIVLPAELGASSEAIFRPVDPAVVPELADLLDFLAEHHPLVLAAVADVDRSLIWSMQENTPLENLENCSRMARDISTLQEAMSASATGQRQSAA